jgi:hypothetical protein
MYSKLRLLILLLILGVLLLPVPTRSVKAAVSPESDLTACITSAGTWFLICTNAAAQFSLFGPGLAARCGEQYADAIDSCAAAYDAAVPQ